MPDRPSRREEENRPASGDEHIAGIAPDENELDDDAFDDADEDTDDVEDEDEDANDAT
jgi:hypothetical protein